MSFYDDRGTHRAGALTYYATMSLFPLLLLAVSLLGLLRVVLTPPRPQMRAPIPTRRVAGDDKPVEVFARSQPLPRARYRLDRDDLRARGHQRSRQLARPRRTVHDLAPRTQIQPLGPPPSGLV